MPVTVTNLDVVSVVQTAGWLGLKLDNLPLS